MIVDIFIRLKGEYSATDPHRFLYPWMLQTIGPLHVMWGGVEKCFKASDLYFGMA